MMEKGLIIIFICLTIFGMVFLIKQKGDCEAAGGKLGLSVVSWECFQTVKVGEK